MRAKVYWNSFSTPWGSCAVAENGRGIVAVTLPSKNRLKQIRKPSYLRDAEFIERKTPLLQQAQQQLIEYFEGKRQTFALPLDLYGTPFQRKVWKQLRKIPYGRTKSYGEIARAIGRPKAARAVGLANHYNPIPIVVPCHRVNGKTGKLVGYGGGLPLKQKLLDLEMGDSNLISDRK